MTDTLQVTLQVDGLDTPALLVDLDALEHNARHMAARCADAGLAWRPHVKACKTPELARIVVDCGAVGITCAKVSEAEAMVAGGLDDILIANEVVGQEKVARLVGLARAATICVAVDDEANLRMIAGQAVAAGVTVDVLVDVDVNLHRCGVDPSDAAALCLRAGELEGVRLRGLMGYEGHVMGLEPEEKERQTRISAELLSRARRDVEAAGIEIGVLSGGGSGNYRFVLQQGMLTELQAGGAVLMDLTYESMGVAGHQRALSLSAQVVSAAASGRAAADAGWKSTGRHTGLPQVVAPDGVRCVGLSAEHTHLALDDGAVVQPGDRVRLVPHYSDSTMLLHRTLHAHRGADVVASWTIAAAGALQ